MKNVASKIIVDNVLLYGRTAGQLLDYFRTVMNILKHRRDSLNLKIFKWFQDRCEFVGVDVVEGVTQPAQSQNEAFSKAIATKYMGRPPHTHWELWVLQTIISPI